MHVQEQTQKTKFSHSYQMENSTYEHFYNNNNTFTVPGAITELSFLDELPLYIEIYKQS